MGKLKITETDMGTLKLDIERILAQYPGVAEKYQKAGHSHERFRWDVFWKCDSVFRRDLYDYLKDSHIDAAVRQILGDDYPKEQEGETNES